MKRNYTLIELLTVIGIIAILAGLIMPAISIGVSRAKRAKCASNLKQVGSMIMLFSSDRDGSLPIYNKATAYTVRAKKIENAKKTATGTYEDIANASTNLAADQKTLWTAGLLRYAQYNMSIFYCPSDENRALDLFTKDANASYALNYYNADRPGGTDGNDTASKIISATRSAASIILVGEAPQGLLGMNTNTEDFFTKVNHDPHKKYYNFQYLDGHGEPIRVGDLKGLYTADTFKMK